MRIYTTVSRIKPSHFIRPVVAIGVFDGFHRGHQKVVKDLVGWAKKVGGESVILTFKEHPRLILRTREGGREGLSVGSIFSLRHRLLFLARAGVDNCIVLPFTEKLANTSAETFVRDVLCKRIGIVGILMGFDSSFGRRCEGNLSEVSRLAEKYGFQLRVCREVRVGRKIPSSTLIRRLITSGRLAEAASLLGRNVSLLGTVVRGVGRGKELGFPTANLNLHHETKPPCGVYAGEARIDPFSSKTGRVYPALINIGKRPTFSGKDETVEVHLVGFNGELYGREIEVSFIRRLRGEQRFRSPESLSLQIAKDRERTLSLIGKRKRRRE